MQSANTFYGPPSDSFIVEPGKRWAYSHHPTFTDAVRRLGQLMLDLPDQFRRARVVIADRYVFEIEQDDLDQPITEITSERFNDMFDALPPLAWSRQGGFQRFNFQEFFRGRITSQYAQLGERYFTRHVRHGDPATYLTPEVIEHALANGHVRLSEDLAA